LAYRGGTPAGHHPFRLNYPSMLTIIKRPRADAPPRRAFLRQAAGAVLSVALAPTAWAGLSTTGADRPLVKKSLKYGMIKAGDTILEKFMLIKELGFHGVELDSPSALVEREVLDARDRSGIEIPGLVNALHWQAPLSDPDPTVRARCVESMKEALRQCRRLGGTTVLLVPAVVNQSVSYDDAYRRSQDEIRKLLPAAEDAGVKIAIENVWNNFLLSPMEAARYIDEFDSPMIGWYFDVGNILRYGWPEQWIRILGPRILKIDIKEYSREKMREEGLWKGFEVEIGEGDCDWPAVNKALRDIGYQGWGSAEVNGGDRDRLMVISRQMDRIYSM
jgi:L-ribulose-5-phosphate 3-epimerase